MYLSLKESLHIAGLKTSCWGVMVAQWTVSEPRSDTNFCSVHGLVRFSVPFVHFLQFYVDFLEAFVLSHNVKVVSRLHRCYYLFMRRCAA